MLNDYVEPESRGKGVSYMSMSIILAEIFALAILFQFTKEMDFESAFLISGAFLYIGFLVMWT